MVFANENEIDIETRDTAVEKIKQYEQEQYAKEWKEDYISTVDEELKEIRKKQEAEEAKRAVRANISHPVNVSGLVPASMSQADRDVWDTIILGPQMYMPGEKPKSREELWKEQEEQAVADYDAGTAEAIVRSGDPENIAKWRAWALAYEKYKSMNTAEGPENSYEYENAERKAFKDIMSNPELYQYTKTGNFETDYTNALLYDQLLGRAIYNKTKDLDIVEEIAGQFFPETSAAFAGAAAASPSFLAGPVVGGIVTGTAAYSTLYEYRKTKLGFNTSSINSIGKLFLEDYHKLLDRRLSKIEFNTEVNKLVDKYFTDGNRPYWGDLSSYIMGGEKDYLDMGPLTSLVTSVGTKLVRAVFKGGRSLFKPKTKLEAIKQAESDAKDLAIYKQEKAEDSNKVYEGEIVSGKIMRTDTGVNEGMSKEGIIIDVNSYDIKEPDGKTVHVFRDPKTGRVVEWGSYKTLGDGGHAELISLMHKQDIVDSVSPSVGVKDIDSVIGGGSLTYIGTGADGVQPFESIRAVNKAIAKWSDKIQSNQLLVPVEESTGQYYMGVVTAPDESFFNLGIKSIEKKDGTTVIWHDKEFDSFEDALGYRNDLREMELEGQGLTPVSAAATSEFTRFKNNERAGLDSMMGPYHGPGNYASVDNRGVDGMFNDTVEKRAKEFEFIDSSTGKKTKSYIRDLTPESREAYLPAKFEESLHNLIVKNDKLDEYISKKLKESTVTKKFSNRHDIYVKLRHAFEEDGLKGFNNAIQEGLRSENSVDRIIYQYVDKNRNKIKASVMSSSVSSDEIKAIKGSDYGRVNQIMTNYLENLDKFGKDISKEIEYQAGRVLAQNVKVSDVQLAIMTKLVLKNPIRYTGKTKAEIVKELKKGDIFYDVPIDMEQLEKDYLKEYKKILKKEELEILSHDPNEETIVVSNPNKLNKVNMIETITADGKHIQKAVDNGYVIRYNKETGKFEIGEVRGGEYTLEQDVEDLGIW